MAEPVREPAAALARGLGLFDASALIIGSVIGSAIFVAPALMAAYVQSPALLLGLWALGGALTLCGALAYAELVAALPRAGGAYVFLSEAFGPACGFLYGWTFLFAINTGFIAAVSVAFAKYLGVFVPAVSESAPLATLAGVTLSSAQGVALLVILGLTAVNALGLRAGARVQNVFTLLKVAAVGVLLALAVVLRGGNAAHFSGGALELGGAGAALGLVAASAVALSKALAAYDCWYYVAFVAEEVRSPARNLPRALLVGTLGVSVVYLAAVAFYVYMVPLPEMAAVPDARIAALAAERLLGAPGRAFISLAILASTFGCVNGLVLSGARVVYAMARDGLFFRALAGVHARFRTPAPALALQGLVAAALALSGSYSDLLTLTAFVSLLFNVLAVAALFVLRRARPELERPYRAWGYPVLPALYVLASGAFLLALLVGDPRNAGLGLAITAAGLPAYALLRARTRAPGDATRS